MNTNDMTINQLREKGYAIAIFEPDEFSGCETSRNQLESTMVEVVTNLISNRREFDMAERRYTG